MVPSEPVLKILIAIADEKSFDTFRSIAYASIESDAFVQQTDITRKECYSRISGLRDAGIMRRKNKKSCPTSLDKVIYGLQMIAQRPLVN